MHSRDFKETLFVKLADPLFAVEYLKDPLEAKDVDGFLLAVRDVLEANGGLGSYAKNYSGLHRVSLYKTFSSKGNPLFSTIINVLENLGIGLQPYVKVSKKKLVA